MTTDPSVAEEGKDVIDANGDLLGTVKKVERGVTYVDPVEDIDETAARALAWTHDSDVYSLGTHQIDTITDSTIILCSNL